MTASPAGTEVRPFRVDIPQSDLDDLDDRLGRVRWPDELAGVDWRYGVPRAYVRELVDYWRSGYDWRAHEARIHEQPQFVTTIDGQRVHFLHVRSPEPDALPLIATHGWPMSVVEYLDLIAPLTDPRAHGGDPADAFHLVLPSLPGVGFSGPTQDAGWDSRRVARAWAELMHRLGYGRYGAHGNDAGSMVSPELGRSDPDCVVGVHVTQLFSFPSGDPSEFEGMSEEDTAALAFLQDFTARGGLAYNAYQSAQPQTLAYALQDSPAGWLAWVTQLFQRAVDRDYIITNAAIYWLTNTVGSSIRRYYEEARSQAPSEPTTTPTGVAIFRDDFQSIRRLAERDHAHIVRWTRYDRGSHFSPHDAPDLLVHDIREFFRGLR
jgi:pimeloyl-ACP methyl ester carboxylesterase